MTLSDFKTYISGLVNDAQKIMEAYDDVIRDLEANLEANTAYVEYGVKMRSNYSSDAFGAYDPNPVRDRYVGNVKRGKITKRPKDPSKSPYVYYHDAAGTLLCVENRWRECPSRSTKVFLLYDGSQCWGISRLYESGEPTCNYDYVHHVRFKNGRIASVSYLSAPIDPKCAWSHVESAFFEYDSNDKNMVVTTVYYDFDESLFLNEREFQCNSEGTFESYKAYDNFKIPDQAQDRQFKDFPTAGSVDSSKWYTAVSASKLYRGTWKCIPPITQEELDDPRCMFPCWKASLTMQDR